MLTRFHHKTRVRHIRTFSGKAQRRNELHFNDVNDYDNRLIQVFCKKGQLDRAMDTMFQMQTSPSDDTYMSLLRACIKKKSISIAKQIYAHVNQHKSRLSGLLGGYLVITLAKCGAIQDACLVSASLVSRTVFSWTAIITAYVDLGLGQEALKAYGYMLEDGVKPNAFTFVSLFKACGIISDLDQGMLLHAEAHKRGFTKTDVFVGTTLVTMYGKCKALDKAEEVFVSLPLRNVVSWNAVLSASHDQGQGERALLAYRQMIEEGIRPNRLTFVIALQSCVGISEKEVATAVDGQQLKSTCLGIIQGIHSDARRELVSLDVSLCTTLVSLYGKCGAIHEAESVFCTLSKHDVIIQTAMLSAYVQQCNADKALLFYTYMQKHFLRVDKYAHVLAIQACSILSKKHNDLMMNGTPFQDLSLDLASALYMDSQNSKLSSDPFVGTALLSMFRSCGCVTKAEEVFCALDHHDIVSWNAMLCFLVDIGDAKRVLQLYRQMQHLNVNPDKQTLMSVIQACSILAENDDPVGCTGKPIKLVYLEIGQSLHATAHRNGFMSDVVLNTVLLDMYCKCGASLEAQKLFNSRSFCHDAVSWNVLLSSYIDNAQPEEAFELYKQMQKQCVGMDDGTLLCILQACRMAGNLEVCMELHFVTIYMSYEAIPFLAATIISTYGSCGNLVDVQAIFNGLSDPDGVVWNACIAGYAGEGSFRECLSMHEELQMSSQKIDEVTTTSLLLVCNYVGFVHEAIEHFVTFRRHYNIKICLKHYGVLVDLLGRAGDFKRIDNMLKEMRTWPDLTIWLCLLGACHTHGNVVLAQKAFNHAVDLEPEQTTAYILMSNIHASLGLKETAYS